MEKLTELFNQMAQSHRNVIREYLSGFGLYLGQHRILFALKDNPNQSQTDMCEVLNVTKESLSVSLKRLECNGLLIRQVDKADRRRVLWTLSERGSGVAEQCRNGFDAINTKMFSLLSTTEKDELGRLFTIMINGLETEENNETNV